MPLTDWAAEIQIIVDDEHRRFELAEVPSLRVRGELAVLARDFPGQAAVLVFVEPEFLGGAPHAFEVINGAMRDEALELFGDVVDGEPVLHVAAETRAGRAHAILVHVGELLDRFQSGHEVAVALAAPVAGNLIDEFLAKSCRTAWIGERDDVALCGPERGVPAPAPAVFPSPLRSAVDQVDDGVFFGGVEARRFEDPHLHLAIFNLDLHRLRPGSVQFRQHRIVCIRDLYMHRLRTRAIR